MKTSKKFLAAALFFSGTLSTFGNGKIDTAGTTIEFDEMSISAEDGTQAIKGNVVVSVGNLDLRTHELLYNSKTNSAKISGATSVSFDAIRFVVKAAEYDASEEIVSAKNVRGGRGTFFTLGEKIEASSEKVVIENSFLFFGEPHWSTISIAAGTMTYVAKDDKLRAEDIVIRVAGVPVLYVPELSTPRFERPPIRTKIRVVKYSKAGEGVQSTNFLTLWENFEPGVLLDFYTSSGLLAGPALNYDFRENENFATSFRGEFQSAFINDTANRSRDHYKNKTTSERSFVNWFHKQELSGAELTAALHYWSDGNVVRNFRDEIYDANQNPDTFLEFVVPARRFYLSVLARFNVNDFQNTQQRLPEIRLDLVPDEIIAGTGIYQHGFISYAFLREENSPLFSLNQTNNGDVLESSRADFYYGFDRPINFGDFATFRPVAGIRLTHYAKTVPENASDYTRVLGQVGFDFNLLATGTFDYDNDVWKIRELKHAIRPVVQYRYFPGTTQQSGKIPEIDREIYYTTPTILDLEYNRAVDQIYDEHVLRLGIENFFRTRNENYGSRDLLSVSIYQDLRRTERPVDNKNFSDNFISLEFSPFEALTFYAAQRTDFGNFDTRTFFSGVELSNGDLWKVSFGFRYVDDPDLAFYDAATKARQYTVSGEFKLNSIFSIYGSIRYDDLRDIFSYQRYGILQRLGNLWLIDYFIKYRQHAGEDDSFSFNIAATMLLF